MGMRRSLKSCLSPSAGAKYMAEQGSDYQEILSHYYQDAVLTNL